MSWLRREAAQSADPQSLVARRVFLSPVKTAAAAADGPLPELPAEDYFSPEVIDKIMDHNRRLWDDAVEAQALLAMQYLQETDRQLWDADKAAEAVARAYEVEVDRVFATPIMVDVLGQVLTWMGRRPPIQRSADLAPEGTPVLYHGTDVASARKILQEGVMPRYGDWVASHHGQGGEPLVFAADLGRLNTALRAMTYAIGQTINKDEAEVTLADAHRHGALIEVVFDRPLYAKPVLEPGNFGGYDIRDVKTQETVDMDVPKGVELEDHFSFDPGQPVGILVGDDLVDFLRRHVNLVGEYFTDWAEDLSGTYATASFHKAGKDRAIDWDEVAAIAEQIRGSIIKCEPSDGLCSRMTEILVSRLNSVGIPAHAAVGLVRLDKPYDYAESGPISSASHAWAVVGDKIVDVTADQFNHWRDAEMPPVFIGQSDRYVANYEEDVPPLSPEYLHWSLSDAGLVEGSFHKAAQSDGLIGPFYHFTRTATTEFDEGVGGLVGHFGPVNQAETRRYQSWQDGLIPDKDSGEILQVYLDVHNPVRMSDVHFDESLIMADDLRERGILTDQEWMSVDRADNDAGIAQIVDILLDKGYDGIVYANNIEGAGEDTYIPFSPDQVVVDRLARVAGIVDPGSRLTLTDELRVWARAAASQEERVPSIVLDKGTQVKVLRRFRASHGGNPELVEIQWPDTSGGGGKDRQFGQGVARADDLRYASAPASDSPEFPAVEPEGQVTVDAVMAAMKVLRRVHMAELYRRVLGDLDLSDSDEHADEFGAAIAGLQRAGKIRFLEGNIVELGMDPESVPQTVDEVPGMSPAERERRVNDLLDQYDAADPAGRATIERQLRDLRASLRLLRRAHAGWDEDDEDANVEPAYPHGPECFCDECLAVDEALGMAAPRRCPTCGSRECPGDGESIDCRKPGTATVHDVPVETRDSLLDRFNAGEIDEATLRRRMRQIASASAYAGWIRRVADLNTRMPHLVREFGPQYGGPAEAEAAIRQVNQAGDPTGNQAVYTAWLLRQLKSEPDLAGSLPEFKDLLATFDKVKSLSEFPREFRDVNKLDSEHLRDLVSDYYRESLAEELDIYLAEKAEDEEQAERERAVAAGLTKTADVVEVVVNNPGMTPSGTCALCETMDGELVDEVGPPPYHPRCMTADMEVLTDSGWITWPNVSGKELFLSVNLDTGDAEWVKAKHLVAVDYNGPIKRYVSRYADIAVTPNHTHVVMFRKKNKGRKDAGVWKLVNDEDLPEHDYSFLATIPSWSGYTDSTIQIAGHTFDTLTFCRFMGIFLSEGSVIRPIHKKRVAQVCVTQEKYKEEFADVMRRMFTKTWIGKGRTMYAPIADAALFAWFSQFGKSWEKYIPEEIKKMGKPYLSEFLRYYAMGDGSCHRNTSLPGAKTASYSTNYFTSSDRMASDIGELVLKVGGRPSYQKQKPKWTTHKNGTYYTSHPCWVICHGTQTSYSSQNLRVETIHYHGKVYDVELEKFHTLIVRRNGRVVVTGNCACSTRTTQRSRQPAHVLDDAHLFEGFDVEVPHDVDDPDADVDQGGVTDLGEIDELERRLDRELGGG